MEPVATDDDRDSTDSADIDAARRQIRDHGETICREERARALRRLEERRSLSERETRVIRTLAERLTESLLEKPEEVLRATASDETGEETARVVLDLFGET